MSPGPPAGQRISNIAFRVGWGFLRVAARPRLTRAVAMCSGGEVKRARLSESAPLLDLRSDTVTRPTQVNLTQKHSRITVVIRCGCRQCGRQWPQPWLAMMCVYDTLPQRDRAAPERQAPVSAQVIGDDPTVHELQDEALSPDTHARTHARTHAHAHTCTRAQAQTRSHSHLARACR